MGIIKNLICIENNRASVIRLKSDKLEFVKKDGEIDFPVTIDFWDWWKRVASYVNGDAVDICFIYDKPYDLLQVNDITKNNIINSDESSWKFEHIKSYFWELKPIYFNLQIVGLEQQECVISGNKGPACRSFYTNLNFNEQDIKHISSAKKEDGDKSSQITEDEYSKFAQYFVDLIRRERE